VTGAWPRPLLAANWKMNLGPHDARVFVASYTARQPAAADRTVVLIPPALSLTAAREAAAPRPDLAFGVQNVYWEPKGAFTGEVSAPMARAAGAAFALVGHSERRHIFRETDADTARKCAAVSSAELTPILCVGELLSEREAGQTSDVVVRQLRAGLSHLTSSQRRGVVVAYEPVWAIGTGRTATPADAAETHAVLASALDALEPGLGGSIPILYGGSVNLKNIAELLAEPEINGVLVGGASLDPKAWAELVRTGAT